MDYLDVILPYSNPVRWASRLKLFRECEDRMLATKGVRLTTVECQTGARPFQLEDRLGVNRVRTRHRTMLWIKECMINDGVKSAVQHYGDGCEYIGWVDGDVTFRDPDWAFETVHELQHYNILQPWAVCYDLGPQGQHIDLHHSFCEVYLDGRPIVQGPHHHGKPYRFAHPGYAWAARRRPLAFVGGLADTAILGAADHHMAMALLGQVADTYPKAMTEAYKAPLLRWQDRALMMSGFARNIGIVRGTIEHPWHGPKKSRKYVSRWDILESEKFDPRTDLVRNEWGIWELAGNKPRLARKIDQYFRQRDEDSNTLGEDTPA